MRIKAEQILMEIENLKNIERSSYLNGSETAKSIWTDLERHTKQLRIVLKAGDFDDLGEREIPTLIEKIKVKKSDWLALVNIEKAREINSTAALKELGGARNRIAMDVHSQRASIRAVQEERVASASLGDWLELNRSTVESFCATTFVVVIIQLALNVYLFNQVKVTTQYSIIDPLEQQLHMTESKNIQMAKRLSDMKKEVSLYRTLMRNMPLESTRKKTSKVNAESNESLRASLDESLGLIVSFNGSPFHPIQKTEYQSQ